MACFLKQSTAADIAMGPFLDSTDGNTAETSLTITQPDVRLKKNGGAWAQKSAAQTLSHEENGWYEVSLSATDTNTLGILMVAVHESGALPVWREFMVVPANTYDSLVDDSDTLQADVTQFNGTNGTFASGRPEVNTSHIAGSAVSTTSAQIGVNVVNAAGTAWLSGAIPAAALGSDAITAAKVAADVGTEIGTAVWVTAARTLTANTNLNDLSAAGVRAAVGLASANLDTQIGTLATAANLSTVAGYIDTEVATIVTQTTAASIRTAVGLASANLDTQIAAVQADTDNIQTRIPAALVSGRIDASVEAMAANTLTASALATDAVTEIAAGISVPSASTVAETVWESLIGPASQTTPLPARTARRSLMQLWQDNVKR